MGYLYGTYGLTNTGQKNYGGGASVTAHCASDQKLSFKLTAPTDWHTSDLVINVIGGGSGYHLTAANTFAITAARHSLSNW